MGIFKRIKNIIKVREYKIINGKLCISEHGSPFLPLLDHLCRDHPKEWARLKAFEEELKNGK